MTNEMRVRFDYVKYCPHCGGTTKHSAGAYFSDLYLNRVVWHEVECEKCNKVLFTNKPMSAIKNAFQGDKK